MRVTFTRAHECENFFVRSQKFFVRAIAKRAVAHPNIFSQAMVFGGPRNAESIKNERISAN